MIRVPLLSEIRYLDMEINSKEQVLAEYKAMVKQTSRRLSPTAGRGKGGESRNLETTMIRIVELEKELDEDIDKLVAKKQMANNLINRIENPQYRILLVKRYFLGKEFLDIGKEMNLAETTVYKFHHRAVQEFLKLYNAEMGKVS